MTTHLNNLHRFLELMATATPEERDAWEDGLREGALDDRLAPFDPLTVIRSAGLHVGYAATHGFSTPPKGADDA
jgi:hypothetical protein